MGVPMPEDAPGGTGRAVLGEVGEVETLAAASSPKAVAEGTGSVGRPGPTPAPPGSPAQPSTERQQLRAHPREDLGVPRWRVTPRICGQLKD